MIYNFNAIDDSSSEEEDQQQDIAMTEEDKKRNEIQKLQKIRDEKRKQLLQMSKQGENEDIEHQNKIKELSKNALKLSKTVSEQKKAADELEKKLATIPIDPEVEQQKPLSEQQAQNEAIRNLRLQIDSLKVEISKSKRALALEGGNKNRAVQIKKLRQQMAEIQIPEEDPNALPTKSAGAQFDIPELKADIAKLSGEQSRLDLKLKGLRARVKNLNPTELKAQIKEKLKQSQSFDERINKLKPKPDSPDQKKPKQYKLHITQQSRLSVMIHGLHHELIERQKEINHNKTPQGEIGITREIERMQKRLHLLESSMSCCI